MTFIQINSLCTGSLCVWITFACMHIYNIVCYVCMYVCTAYIHIWKFICMFVCLWVFSLHTYVLYMCKHMHLYVRSNTKLLQRYMLKLINPYTIHKVLTSFIVSFFVTWCIHSKNPLLVSTFIFLTNLCSMFITR